MRKILIFCLILFSVFAEISGQNLNIKFSKAAVNAGDTANVDVTVGNFNSLFGTQFSVSWDSTKFKFGAIANLISPNTILGTIDVGFPSPNSTVKQGKMTFLWFATQNSVSLPNDTRLFTLRLKAAGNPCDSTTVDLSNLPLKSEYYDQNSLTQIPTSTPGSAKINGVGCTNVDPGGDEVTVTAATLITAPASVVCVPITVKNFINIEGAQSKINWDPAVLKMKPLPLKYDALPLNNYNTGNVNAGEFNFVWYGTEKVTIPDGMRLMEVCFDVIGAAGTMSKIDLHDSELETEYSDVTGILPFKNIDGKVTVAVSNPVKVTVSDVMVDENQNVDVTFSVDNFTDITAVQLGVTWNKNIIQFVDRNSDALAGPAPQGNLEASGDTYKFNWLAAGSSTITLPNGSTLFKMKFKGNPCAQAGTSVVDVTNIAPNFNIEFIEKSTAKLPYVIDAGSVVLKPCPIDMPVCQIVSSTNVDCFNGSNGSITATVTNGTSDCVCVWKKDGLLFGNSLPITNCNLTNIPAGTYLLEVTCSGVVKSTCTAVITQQPAINITGNITNISCAILGAISLNVTGGTPAYNYSWSNTATTKDISNLPKGQYTVKVTDSKNCEASKTFDVGENPVDDLKVNAVVENVKCFGESTGSIKLNVTGGCPEYKYEWASSPEISGQRLNLAVGTYGVTVSDKSNPAKTVAQQIVVAGPASALNVTGIASGSTGSNGAIDVTVTGGTPTYSYKWIQGSSATTEDLTGLAPGTYGIEVTDANGCKKTATFVVDTIPVDGPSFANVSVSTETANSGYGVSCNGLCDATISGKLNAAGTAPYTVTLSGTSAATKQLTTADVFSFTGLCVGTYTVKVTDASGKSSQKADIRVTQPGIITISKTVDCTESGLSNGAVDISVSGGAGSFTYAWSNGDKTEDIDGLGVGKYAVVVSDANGCQQTLQNLSVTDCNAKGDCFTDVLNVLTPNSDGVNDYFLITCAAEVDNELFVYDRWGKLVFSQKNYSNLWGGRDLNDELLPENGYMWVLNVKNGDGSKDTYKGTLTILRD